MNTTVTANLIDGEFRIHDGAKTIPVTNPATRSAVVGHVPALVAGDLPAIFDAAERGARAWRATGVLDRARVLYDAAALLRDEADELTSLIVQEMGKTSGEARGEVGKAAEFFEYYAGLSRLPFGELLPDARPGTFSMQMREPVGVVVLITPWNDPLLTPARKLAPALLAGNSVVIKPATEAPLIALRLAALLHRAGLPSGVLATVTGRGAELGNALVDDPRIAAVSFTGSTAIGKALKRHLADRQVRVQTEMGGKNASVIMADADIEFATTTVLSSAYAQAGQRCTATSRLIVQRGAVDEVSARLTAAIEALRVGPGADARTTMGPVVSARARRDIDEVIEQSLRDGATVIAAGTVSPDLSDTGAYVRPLLLRVRRDNVAWRQEIFGPVVALVEVDDLAAAIDAVNDSTYGLSSSLFTQSLGDAHAFVAGVDTGQVSVNQPTSGWDVHQPFGGFGDSGSSFKEQGLDALRFYSRVKTAAIRAR